MRNEVLAVTEKRGIPVYLSNPSIPSKEEISRPRKAQIGNDQKGLIINEGTGEILGVGGAMVYEWEEVDRERFVKLFLAGLKQAAGLTKSGLAVLELVYNAVREKPGEDTVRLSFMTSGMKKTTYYAGLRELLKKEFIFRSPWDGVFFVNIRYLFNGNRLAFVNAYHLKSNRQGRQQPLPPPVAE